MRYVRWTALAAWMLFVIPALAGADTYHTPLDPSKLGGLKGTIAPAQGLETVIALEPTDIKAYQAQVDPASGRFVFQGLPPGEYDLLVKVTGKVYEGLTLETEEDLAPEPTSAPAGPTTAPATAPTMLGRIRDEIVADYAKLENYFNRKRIVRLAGTPQKARMMVVQVRTLPVVDPAGDKINANIRRIDFVDLVKTRKVWQVRTNRHVLRQEVPYQSADNELTFTHSPALGRLLVGESMRDLGVMDLKKLPPSPPGRYVGAEFDAR